jgi:hypothetical protein
MFGALKKAIRHMKIENSDMIGAFRTQLHEQDKVWEAEDTHKHTHTHLSSLAQCWKSGGRVCKNVGMQSNHQSSFCVIFII